MKYLSKEEMEKRDRSMTEDYRTMTLVAIAKKYGMTHQNVRFRVVKYMRKKGLNFSKEVYYRRHHPRYTGPDTKPRNRAICDDAAMTLNELSKKYHLTTERVGKILKEHGFPSRIPDNSKRNRALFEDYKTMTQIQLAKKYNISQSWVSFLLIRMKKRLYQDRSNYPKIL